MIYLLDVNVLIAILDSDHIFHDQAHSWFEQTPRAGWATCPLTENGVIRILGHPKYPKSFGGPGAVAAVLRSMQDIPRHQFWPDEISLLTSRLVDIDGLATSGRVTDTYLLALAASKGGKFATFDRRMSTAGVLGGEEVLHVID